MGINDDPRAAERNLYLSNNGNVTMMYQGKPVTILYQRDGSSYIQELETWVRTEDLTDVEKPEDKKKEEPDSTKVTLADEKQPTRKTIRKPPSSNEGKNSARND